MMQSLALLLMALSAVLAAPALVPAPLVDDEYPLAERREYADQIIVPQKRAALVLDRLLIALQKALHDEAVGQRLETDREGPRTAPLRIANFDNNDVSGLQRRGQGTGRGRVLRCYFNAITCF
ncbi:uncharacterized protein LOC116770259 [Danaus plexippus]|uniref:uncharacterized protein LOC116770259 n=1 Tax=Danaus plexippus TaxID=13037 RepID=UPI000239C295|nr:uncharacterized protein LOC116770259 [Danaus plexippus]XP_032517563.1 uncharacterized protein LOC116770265 [Danaus plexippus plexippus]